jgi:hypothetical protein
MTAPEADIVAQAEKLMRIAEQAKGTPGYGVSPNFLNALQTLLNSVLIKELKNLPRFTDTPTDSKATIQLVAWHDIEDRIKELELDFLF